MISSYRVMFPCALILAFTMDAWSFETDGMGPSESEHTREVPAGRWQQHCELFRSDLPNAHTLGATRMMYLTIIHDAGASFAEVDWAAERAICWGEEPCDLMKARGQTVAQVTGEHGGELVMSLEFPPNLHLQRAFMVLRQGSSSAPLSGLLYFTDEGGVVQYFGAQCNR